MNLTKGEKKMFLKLTHKQQVDYIFTLQKKLRTSALLELTNCHKLETYNRIKNNRLT